METELKSENVMPFPSTLPTCLPSPLYFLTYLPTFSPTTYYYFHLTWHGGHGRGWRGMAGRRRDRLRCCCTSHLSMLDLSWRAAAACVMACPHFYLPSTITLPALSGAERRILHACLTTTIFLYACAALAGALLYAAAARRIILYCLCRACRILPWRILCGIGSVRVA